jgi:hypothetical protein
MVHRCALGARAAPEAQSDLNTVGYACKLRAVYFVIDNTEVTDEERLNGF